MIQNSFGVFLSANVRKTVLLLLVLFLGFDLGAQEQGQAVRRLTPDEAVDLALRNNLSLEASRVSSGTRRRRADNAWNVFMPTLDVAAAMRGANSRAAASPSIPFHTHAPNGDMIPFDIPLGGSAPQWTLIVPSLSLSWSLNFALFEGMKAVRADFEAGLLSYESAKAQLERDVRKAYFNILLIHENIALLEESFVAAERRVAMAQANYNAGLAPELTLLQAQVAMENMRPTIDQAQNGLKLSMVQFAMNLGLPLDTEFELVPAEEITDFIDLDLREFISAASVGKPDIIELKHNIRLLETRRRATAYQLYTPTLNVSWNFNPMVWSNPGGWGTWDNVWRNPRESGGVTISLGFRLNTLLPFGSEQANLRDMDDSLRGLRINLAQLIRGTELEIYSIILELERVQTSLAAQSRTVELAERTYQLTETAHRAGLQDLLEVQNAELELRRARVGVLEQQFTYIRGLIDLEYAMGVPFGTLSGSIR